MEGRKFRLRPAELRDAEFIVELRADPERSRYVHRIAPDVAAQKRWMEEYFERWGDYYFIVERRGSAVKEGTVAIYNVDAEKRAAEWGRWIVRAGSGAAVESASLLYRVAFETLALDSVYCRTIAENTTAIEIHRRFGVEQVATLADYFELDGRSLEAVEARLSAARWRERQMELAAAQRGRP